VFDGFRPNYDIADREIWIETAGSADTCDSRRTGKPADEVLRPHGILRLSVTALRQCHPPSRDIGARQLQIREDFRSMMLLARPHQDRPFFGQRSQHKNARLDCPKHLWPFLAQRGGRSAVTNNA
jgi:hypothetical protein